MSIFITNLAFTGNNHLITESKMAILIASTTAAIAGLLFLSIFGAPNEGDTDMDTMDFEEDEIENN